MLPSLVRVPIGAPKRECPYVWQALGLAHYREHFVGYGDYEGLPCGEAKTKREAYAYNVRTLYFSLRNVQDAANRNVTFGSPEYQSWFMQNTHEAIKKMYENADKLQKVIQRTPSPDTAQSAIRLAYELARHVSQISDALAKDRREIQGMRLAAGEQSGTPHFFNDREAFGNVDRWAVAVLDALRTMFFGDLMRLLPFFPEVPAAWGVPNATPADQTTNNFEQRLQEAVLQSVTSGASPTQAQEPYAMLQREIEQKISAAHALASHAAAEDLAYDACNAEEVD